MAATAAATPTATTATTTTTTANATPMAIPGWGPSSESRSWAGGHLIRGVSIILPWWWSSTTLTDPALALPTPSLPESFTCNSLEKNAPSLCVRLPPCPSFSHTHTQTHTHTVSLSSSVFRLQQVSRQRGSTETKQRTSRPTSLRGARKRRHGYSPTTSKECNNSL